MSEHAQPIIRTWPETDETGPRLVVGGDCRGCTRADCTLKAWINGDDPEHENRTVMVHDCSIRVEA